jgi:hypothetical protein
LEEGDDGEEDGFLKNNESFGLSRLERSNTIAGTNTNQGYSIQKIASAAMSMFSPTGRKSPLNDISKKKSANFNMFGGFLANKKQTKTR